MKTYIVEQKITAFVNRYSIYEADTAGDKASMISFVEQKRLKLKEEILFYSDETKQQHIFTVKAENVMDFNGRFFVTDSNGEQIGAVAKVFKQSLWRSTWHMLGARGDIAAIVQERSLGLALFRRLWVLVPFLSDFPFFFKYHFDFVAPSDSNQIAEYVKTTRFRDHYKLTVRDEAVLQELGWQTFVAQAVLLDALQGR